MLRFAAGGREASSRASYLNLSEAAVQLRLAETGGAKAQKSFRKKTDSGVGNHAGYLGVVGVRDVGRSCQLALGLGLLRRKDVAHLRLAPLDLAGSSLLEALGRAAVCLHFGHGLP